MQHEDPYDTRVEKPTRGGKYKVARFFVRFCSFAVRISIMLLMILACLSFAAMIMKSGYNNTTLANFVDTAMNWLWGIIPWGRLDALTFHIGEGGVFYADAILFAVPFVVVDAILDKIYKQLK